MIIVFFLGSSVVEQAAVNRLVAGSNPARGAISSMQIMSLTNQIKTKLIDSLEPFFIEIINQSHKHKGHFGNDASGDETHFDLIVVSEKFQNLSKINRQKLVYDILKTEMNKKIHAFSMKTMTKEEYKSKKKKYSKSFL